MTISPLIAGNWKMFKTCSEAVKTAKRIAELAKDITDIDIMIAPPFTALLAVSEALLSINSRVGVGAQNLFYKNEGAYTGEISANMLKSAGVSYVIVGHSERRQYFGETDDDVRRKIGASLESNLIPIICIGETESEKKEEKTFYVLDKQIENGLKGLRSNELGTLVIAYEPIWAIGTGNTASPNEVDSVHRYIRAKIEKMFDNNLSEGIRIIYGGSVKPDNISELMSHRNINGALVGGASLDPESFIEIIKYNK